MSDLANSARRLLCPSCDVAMWQAVSGAWVCLRQGQCPQAGRELTVAVIERETEQPAKWEEIADEPTETSTSSS